MHTESLPPTDREPTATSRSSRSTFPCDLALRASLLAFRDDSQGRWNNSTISRQIGYSPRVVSDYCAPDGNKYDGDTPAVERAIKEFLRDQRLISDTNVETIQTEITRKIEAAIEDIRTARRIGVIIGDPGIGKTRALALYCRTHELAISFSAWEGECSKTAVADLLFHAADVANLKRGDNKIKVLAEKLNQSGRVIIADDAHKLSPHALQLLYDFRDRAGSPIVLIGDTRLLAKLESDKQRLRRTGAVTYLKIKDPVPLIEHHIDALLPKNHHDERKEIIQLCQQLAKQEGLFGSIQMELSLAARIKTAKPDLSWLVAIQSAHKRLIRKTPLMTN